VKLWIFNPDIQDHVILTPTGSLDNGNTDVWSVAFHPSMPFFASSYSRYARLWRFSPENPQKMENVATLGTDIPEEQQHTHVVKCVAFHPKAPLLVTGSWDNTVKLWSFSPDGSAAGMTTIIHDRELTSVAFHPDPTNSILATCSRDNTINLWQLSSSGSHAQRITTMVVGRYEEEEKFSSMAFYPYSRSPTFHLVTGSIGGIVKIWNVTEKIAHPSSFLMDREYKQNQKPIMMTISEKRLLDKERGERMGGKNRTRRHTHTRRRSLKQQRQQRSRRNSRSRGRGRR
jgi:WD40 repeat protein